MQKFRILDLFCGAGGFSCGLDMLPEFSTEVALDFDKNAINTFSKNFPETSCFCGDITKTEIKDVVIEESIKRKVNMVIGGPPCQGFSLKGKKLGLNDPRNFLFLEYIDIVKRIKPDIFIIENVKGILISEKGYFINEIKKIFSELDYHVNYAVVRADNFGVPQKRERTIIIGSRDIDISVPLSNNLPKTTVRDAISDLSYLESGEGEDETNYPVDANSDYQRMLRNPKGILYNHIATKHSPVAIEKLKLIPPEGDKSYMPKELQGKQLFASTWSRLKWDEPSPTIDTRFDTPSNGRNSHPYLNRAITPREAARIQSFPDTFIFYGNKTSIRKQIGNAVPPLLAKALGEHILKYFKDKDPFQLYNEDAYKIIDEFLKNNLKVDHIICDPPYNISRENHFDTLKGRQGLDFGKWDKNFDLLSWIPKYSKLLNKNGSMIIFCSYRYISYIIDCMEKSDLVVKDIIIWQKTNPMPRNVSRRYVQDTEFAIWAVKKDAKWVFNKPDDKPYLRSLFNAPVVQGKEKYGHPTPKNLDLMKHIIEIHTNPDDVILDPFMGTGTTGIAAIELGRKFIGIEIAKNYFDNTKLRFENIMQKRN